MSNRSEITERTPSDANPAALDHTVSDGDHRTDSAHAAANERTPRALGNRALDTGSRGWRWLVVSSLLALLPCFTCAADSLSNASPLYPLAIVSLSNIDALVPTREVLRLGARLTTLHEARRHLQMASRVPVIAPQWAEIYFNMMPADTAAMKDVSGVAIPGQVDGPRLGFNEHPGRI